MNSNRKYYFLGFVFFVAIAYLVKLFSIQVADSSYQAIAQDNSMKTVVQYPYRGTVVDRNGKLLVQNEAIFDVNVILSDVDEFDTALFLETFPISEEDLNTRLQKASRARWLPYTIVPKLSHAEFSRLQHRLVDFPGFFAQARTDRHYPHRSSANALGYIAEISRQQLDRDTLDYYHQGDYIGKSGLESYYEPYLRGERGLLHRVVNVFGIEKGAFQDGELDELARPGANLVSTLDLDLQQYGERLMAGKVGSVVAIEPKTGEILAIISAPSFDPNRLTGRQYGMEYTQLVQDSLKPFFNRPVMAMYPPGSIFKVVQALIALEEGVIQPGEFIYTDGANIGDHAPPGYYDIVKGIKFSSNNFFYRLVKRLLNQNLSDNTYKDTELGLAMWNEYLLRMGFGRRLGIDLREELPGSIPTPAYYDRVYGQGRWKYSTIASISIGQGEMLLSPLQMANLGCIMANRGYFYTPHLIKEVNDSTGAYSSPIAGQRFDIGIDSVHFGPVIKGMEEALSGTAGRAIIRDITICGKTGTAENPHGADHSVFMAFAPKDDPQIAISVYVENAGWGGRAAASTASLMIEYYLRNGEITRPWLEDFVLANDFLY